MQLVLVLVPVIEVTEKCPQSPKNNKDSSGWLGRPEGEMENPSPEEMPKPSSMSKSDVKKFAKTKHKGLPEKKK